MFILPVGHDEDTLRRWPWVSITIGALCILVFLGLLFSEAKAEEAALGAARRVFEYAADKPYLVVDEDLLFGETAALGDEAEPGVWWNGPEEEVPDGREIRRQQAELDRLTSRWRRLTEEVPMRALGLVPAELSLPRLVSHMFVHAGLLHLLGNLFFFWLLAPPLEDVWGRPLFAAFFLAAGIVAGILWVARYPNSNETVVGASGAIAGLMGAFMVRFWRTRIRFVGFLWVTLKIYAGSFKAPAWIMLGLWFVRELAFASLFEPHATGGGGVATRAHLYGFGFGALAAAGIGAFRVEQRWIRPRLLAATGELEQPALELAFEHEREGRPEEAWRLVEDEVRSRPGNLDAVLYWWGLATKSGREREVAGPLVGVIRGELQRGQADLAWQHFVELRQRLPDYETPPGIKVGLAEALVEVPECAPDVVDLLVAARAELGSSAPPALMARLARTSARAGLPGAASLCARVAADAGLPESVRAELRELAGAVASSAPAGGPAHEKGENR
jgi:membrane associated rhomboid family serine protease